MRQCAGDRLKPSEGCHNHGDPGQSHADDNALKSNLTGAARDGHSFGNAVKAVHHNDHVGRIRRGAGPAGTQSHTDICGGECGRVVAAVADHKGRMQPTLHGDCIHFVDGISIRKDRVDVERRGDGLGRICPVSRHHHDASNPCSAKRLDGTWGLPTQLVAQEQRARDATIDGNKDAERTPPGRATQCP
mgnify:CR=1 FL=1